MSYKYSVVRVRTEYIIHKHRLVSIGQLQLASKLARLGKLAPLQPYQRIGTFEMDERHTFSKVIDEKSSGHARPERRAVWSSYISTLTIGVACIIVAWLTLFPSISPSWKSIHYKRASSSPVDRILRAAPLIGKICPSIDYICCWTGLFMELMWLRTDGHNDFPYFIRALYKNDIYQKNISDGMELPGQVDFPRLRKGGLRGQFWSAFIQW